MNYTARVISNILNLRKPQRESLEILDKISELIPLTKNQNLGKALEAIQTVYKHVEDFERDFPSLCFALATGVGKTRLMGAFIAYLYMAKGIRHFFILAPNLTIYDKLIADFTPGTPKYVFEGINEFNVNKPLLLTGSNFDSMSSHIANEDASIVQINIFNISKINTEVRGGKAPRVKKMSEYLGESYFNYLSQLDDLILLMDEAHRYRADAGMRAIAELNPILGLELTATPQIEKDQKPVIFKNIIYSYPLYDAMEDGYVKEPAVATRENFDLSKYTDPNLLDKLKLSDGIHLHENVKAELFAYAKNNGKPVVKPFMLVICKDTAHADTIMSHIMSDDFFNGYYKHKAITVHSSQKGEEKDETVQRLLAVEDPKEPTEIVVHVNMLKEGWDVTNLYTIVPLRAANSRTLVEQSIGRGLRLPYGLKTGNAAVDRLTIVAHDKFDEIITEANKGHSIIKKTVVIGRDVPDKLKRVVEAEPVVITKVEVKEEQKPAVEAVFNAIRKRETLPTSSKLKEHKQAIKEEVASAVIMDKPDIEALVDKIIESMEQATIDIPRVVLVPKTDAAYRYLDFTPVVKSYQPVEQEILLEHLRTHEREKLGGYEMAYTHENPEDYIMSELVALTQKGGGYNKNKQVIYSLAMKATDKLKSELKDKDLTNVLQYYSSQIASEIYKQMQEHIEYEKQEYEVRISSGFKVPKSCAFTVTGDDSEVFYRDEVDEKSLIRSMLFNGFKKCIYNVQKFDSNTEKLFSIILEDDSDVEKWVKPVLGDFQIFFRDGTHEGHYNPDFVVETATDKYICEMKSGGQTQESRVQAKAEAAEQWCEYATAHALEYGGKPWHYVLVPHDKVKLSATLKVIAEKWVK